MKKIKTTIVMLFVAVISLTTQNKQDDIIGVWETETKDAKMEIFKSGNLYYGKLLWGDKIIEADRKTSKKDAKNPDEKIKDIAEIYQVKKERVSQRKDLKAITNLESRQVTSQKLVLELEKRKKQLDYFKNQIFSFFQVGSTWRSRKSSSVQSKGFMKFSSLKKDIFRYKII